MEVNDNSIPPVCLSVFESEHPAYIEIRNNLFMSKLYLSPLLLQLISTLIQLSEFLDDAEVRKLN
jgi:hypothetical protein